MDSVHRPPKALCVSATFYRRYVNVRLARSSQLSSNSLRFTALLRVDRSLLGPLRSMTETNAYGAQTERRFLKLRAYYAEQGLRNGRVSVHLSNLSTAVAACGGFAAERPAGS